MRSSSHTFIFLRSFSGCRDLTLFALRQAKTGATMDHLKTIAQRENEADSWEFMGLFLPHVIEGLKRHEMVEKKGDASEEVLYTTPLGQIALKNPSDFSSLFRQEFEEIYHDLQIKVLRAERKN